MYIIFFLSRQHQLELAPHLLFTLTQIGNDKPLGMAFPLTFLVYILAIDRLVICTKRLSNVK